MDRKENWKWLVVIYETYIFYLNISERFVTFFWSLIELMKTDQVNLFINYKLLLLIRATLCQV